MSVQQLQQAAEDLALAEQQLTTIGVILAAASFVIADALKAEGRKAKATRRANRQARKTAQGAR